MLFDFFFFKFQILFHLHFATYLLPKVTMYMYQTMCVIYHIGKIDFFIIIISSSDTIFYKNIPVLSVCLYTESNRKVHNKCISSLKLDFNFLCS